MFIVMDLAEGNEDGAVEVVMIEMCRTRKRRRLARGPPQCTG